MLARQFSKPTQLMTADEAHDAESEIIRTGDRLRTLLIAFYERQGYRALGYSSYTEWGEAIAPRIFGMTRAHLTRQLTAAVIERELVPMGTNSDPIPERHLRPLGAFIDRPRGPGADEKPLEINGEAIRAAWYEANERTEGKPTARVVEDVVSEMRGAPHPYACTTCNERFSVPVWHCPGCAHHYHEQDNECGNCHEYTSDGKRILLAPEEDELDPPMELEQVADQFPTELTPTDVEILRTSTPSISRINPGLFTKENKEWYTPGKIIERVEAVFGEIDLDPCSNSSERTTASVPAGAYWTKDDNGLTQPWHGKVYMDPPYGDEIPAWVERLVNAYTAGEIIEGIALLPARTDTAWFQPLFDYPICFVRGRLKFSGAENSAPFPSAVVYVGPDVALFEDWFHDIGRITKPEA